MPGPARGPATLDVSLYLIADSRLCEPRQVVDVVAQAVRGGVTCVQVREKLADARALFCLTTQVMKALDGTAVPVIVNDRLDVALAAGASGVHLGQDDLPVEQARRLAPAGFIVGLSTSRRSDIDQANQLAAGTVDYLGIGPVFATSTKVDAKPALGPATVAALRAATALTCVGIGGITAANAAEAMTARLDGLCVVSAICTAEDPAAAARELRRAGRLDGLRS